MEISGPVFYNFNLAVFLDQSSYNCQGYAGRFTMPWMQRCEKLTNLVFGTRKENVFCMKFIQNTNELTSIQCFLVMLLISLLQFDLNFSLCKWHMHLSWRTNFHKKWRITSTNSLNETLQLPPPTSYSFSTTQAFGKNKNASRRDAFIWEKSSFSFSMFLETYKLLMTFGVFNTACVV